MKRNRIIWLLLAAAVVLPLSCAKEVTGERNESDTPSPDYEGVCVDFTTTFTKTVLGEIQDGQAPVLWEEGDKINIMGYYLDEEEEKQFCVEASASQAGPSAIFTAVVPANATDIYAVYPATACTALTKDGSGNVSIPVDINQSSLTTEFKNAHFCVAKTTLAQKSFLFKNVASIIAFEIEDAANFRKLNVPQLMALDFQNVRGTLPVSFKDDGSLQFGTAKNAAVMLDMSKNTLKAGKHYISVLPASYSEGFALNHNYFDDPTCLYKKPADLSTPKILNIGKIDGKFQRDYYVTVSGAGEKTGKDWANAMGRDEFVATLAKKTGSSSTLAYEKYLQIWILKGTTFHLGAGTYILGDEQTNGLEVNFQGGTGTSYCTIDILGGYPDDGGDLRDIKTNVTRFSGDGKYHILTVKDRARLNIDGITFCNAYFNGTGSLTAEKMGAALFLSDSFANTDTDAQRTAHEKGAARVNLTDCIFEENRNESSTADNYYGGGSAIAIQKGYLHANRCEFRNNYDKGFIGCVTTCGNYDFEALKSELFFNACLFEGNTTGTSKNASGHVVNHSTKGILLGMYNCTFHANDKADSDGLVHNSNVLNIRRSSIIANTTIYQPTYDDSINWTGYPVRVDGGCGGMNRHIFANNILQSLPNQDSKGDYRSFSLVGAYTEAHDGKVFFKGNNIMSVIYGQTATDKGMYKTDSEETILRSKNINMTWNESLKVFEWGAEQTRYTNMSQARMEEILQSTDINNSKASKFTWGSVFYNWLKSIDAVDKDAVGNTRPAEGWLSGSYQQE